METLLKNPYSKELDTVMSNFDHEIDEKVAEELKTKKAFAQYSGWDFCGYVWYDKRKKTYHCEVWVYHNHKETVSGTLEEIMSEVSDEYGYE